MGRADDPDVDRVLGRRPDLADPLLLDRAQQLHLHRERQVADLVEEERPAVRRMKEPFPVGLGAGKRSLAVAEELALHEVLGDRAAVHRHERLVPSRAALVDEARGELLAAPGLAGEIERRLAAGELVDHRAHLLHRRAFTEQPVRTTGLGLGRRLLRQVERRLDERTQLFERQGLRHVVERARLQGRHRVLGAAVRRDHRDREVGTVRTDVAHQLQAVAVGEAHVGEAQVEALALEKAGRLGDRSGALDPEAHPDQGQLQQFADVGFVVDDEHRGLRCCAAFRPVHPRTPCQVIRKSPPAPRST